MTWLFRQHSGFVARLGSKLLGCQADVDDLVQDVFLRAARGLEKLREPAAARRWLAAITVRQAWMARRRRASRPDLQPHDPAADGRLDCYDPAALTDVHHALEHLPPGLRVPWLLRVARGEDLNTIATLCNCSRATVKRRLKAAEAQLKGLLGDEAESAD